MKPFECHGCKWFYTRELKGFKSDLSAIKSVFKSYVNESSI